MRTEVVDDLTALAASAERWDRLAEEAPQRLAMLSHAWVASHLEHRLGPGERWLCALAWDGDDLLGVLPVAVIPHRLWGDRRPKVTGIADGYTKSADALVSSGRARETMAALVTAILAAEPRATGIAFRDVRAGSPTPEAAEAGIGNLKTLQRGGRMGSFVPTEGSIEDYRSGLSKNFKGNLRKARNKLARLPDVEMAFEGEDQATEAGLDDFMALEASGWKGEEGSAIELSPSVVDFYRALCHRLAARGWLEWHELRSEGRLLAGHLATRVGGSVGIVKIAYDEDFAKCAPGNLLMERCLERAFADEGIHEVNCMTDQPWHRNWRMDQEPYHAFTLFPAGPASLVLNRMPAAVGNRARATLKPLRARVGR